MSKKIVVITGSPRKNGNSFAMTDSFIQAAEALDNVHEIKSLEQRKGLVVCEEQAAGPFSFPCCGGCCSDPEPLPAPA